MPRLVAVQMDPVETLNPASDSTLALIAEANRRGWEAVCYQVETLSMTPDTLTAHVTPIKVSLEPTTEITLGEPYTLSLYQADAVLMRQDPPFDLKYITATHMLERLTPGVKVFNDPAAVRNHLEKLIPFDFAEHTPPTLISTHLEDIRAFHREHGDIILKPLHGFAGHSVFIIRKHGENLESLLEKMISGSGEAVIAQRFLPEVDKQEMRVLIIHGQFAGAIIREPQHGEVRSNLRVGGRAQAVQLNDAQMSLCEKLGTYLNEKNILLAGVDMIGETLIEVNITSPTGLRQVRGLSDFVPEAMFWDGVEEQV